MGEFLCIDRSVSLLFNKAIQSYLVLPEEFRVCINQQGMN
jgi:hypothetical protein